MKYLLNYRLFEESANNKVLCYHKSSLHYLKSFIDDGISYDNFSFGHGQGKGFYMYSNIDEDKGLDYAMKSNLTAGGKKDLIIGKFIDINLSNIRVDYEIVKQFVLLQEVWSILKEIILSNKKVELYKISRKDSFLSKFENVIKLNDADGLNQEGKKIDGILNNNFKEYCNLDVVILVSIKDIIYLKLIININDITPAGTLSWQGAEYFVLCMNKLKKEGIDIFEKLDAQIFKRYKEKKATLPIKLIKVPSNPFPDSFWILENNKWIKYPYSEVKKNYEEIKIKHNIEEKKVDFRQIRQDLRYYDAEDMEYMG